MVYQRSDPVVCPSVSCITCPAKMRAQPFFHRPFPTSYSLESIVIVYNFLRGRKHARIATKWEEKKKNALAPVPTRRTSGRMERRRCEIFVIAPLIIFLSWWRPRDNVEIASTLMTRDDENGWKDVKREGKYLFINFLIFCCRHFSFDWYNNMF